MNVGWFRGIGPAGILLALIGLVAMGFLASDASRNVDRLLTVVGITTFLVLCLLTGRAAGPRAAPLAGAVIGTIALMAVVYGNYAAYLFGWHGLQEHDLGSDDHPGHSYVILTLAFSFVPVAVAGAILGFLGSLLPRSTIARH